jgi:hypothetical protein
MSTPAKNDTDKLFAGLHPKVQRLQAESRKRLRNQERQAWSDQNLKPTTTTRYGKR